MPERNGRIDKLEFPSRNERTPLIKDAQRVSSPEPSQASSHAGRFFEDVAEGIQNQDRARLGREIVRYGSFIWAILSWYVIQPARLPFRTALTCPSQPLRRLPYRLLPLRSLVPVSASLHPIPNQPCLCGRRAGSLPPRTPLRSPLRSLRPPPDLSPLGALLWAGLHSRRLHLPKRSPARSRRQRLALWRHAARLRRHWPRHNGNVPSGGEHMRQELWPRQSQGFRPLGTHSGLWPQRHVAVAGRQPAPFGAQPRRLARRRRRLPLLHLPRRAARGCRTHRRRRAARRRRGRHDLRSRRRARAQRPARPERLLPAGARLRHAVARGGAACLARRVGAAQAAERRRRAQKGMAPQRGDAPLPV